jgi:hypothetical protein
MGCSHSEVNILSTSLRTCAAKLCESPPVFRRVLLALSVGESWVIGELQRKFHKPCTYGSIWIMLSSRMTFFHSLSGAVKTIYLYLFADTLWIIRILLWLIATFSCFVKWWHISGTYCYILVLCEIWHNTVTYCYILGLCGLLFYYCDLFWEQWLERKTRHLKRFFRKVTNNSLVSGNSSWTDDQDHSYETKCLSDQFVPLFSFKRRYSGRNVTCACMKLKERFWQ